MAREPLGSVTIKTSIGVEAIVLMDDGTWEVSREALAWFVDELDLDPMGNDPVGPPGLPSLVYISELLGGKVEYFGEMGRPSGAGIEY